MVRNLNRILTERLTMNVSTNYPFDDKAMRVFMYENAMFVVFLI